MTSFFIIVRDPISNSEVERFSWTSYEPDAQRAYAEAVKRGQERARQIGSGVNAYNVDVQPL